MGERSSSLFAKLTLKSKRHSAPAVPSSVTLSSSSSQSASNPATTPETESPTSFSGVADYGLGYSSINYQRSSSYKGKRTSKSNLPSLIEFERCADPNLAQAQRSAHVRSQSRSTKLSNHHAEEEPIFIEIIDGAAPRTPVIQSTVRARSHASTSPPHSAAIVPADLRSPFSISRTASQSHPRRPPARVNPRRCHSVNGPEGIHAPCSSAVTPFAEAAAQPVGASSPSYYAVARGWKKGIYSAKEEAERQIRNFPGPLMRQFGDRASAEDFLDKYGRVGSQTSSTDDAEEEFVERTRIFKGLDPNSDLARRRTISMYAERKEALRKSRVCIATPSPLLRPKSLHSPPLSPRSPLPDFASVSPIDPTNGFATLSLQGMTLLPVTHLVESMAFYAKVLDFVCTSHQPEVQAVMSSTAATVCLRAITSQSPEAVNVYDITDAPTQLLPSTLRHCALPTSSREQSDCAHPPLPPTPESLNVPFTDPEPLELPSTSVSLCRTDSILSGATVLIEHGDAPDAMHSRLTAKLNQWRLDQKQTAASSQMRGMRRCIDGARLLGGVRQTPWNAQELHLCDIDGHRIIYTTPLSRASPGKSFY